MGYPFKQRAGILKGFWEVVMMNPVVFREYDIRGVIGQDFDEDFAFDLGRAYISYVRRHLKIDRPTISVGRDARHSGMNLSQALISGMIKSGAHVLDLGLITTPISYFSTFALPEVQGSIMVTGSHNPPDYNGFKISVGKSTIFGPSIQELCQIIKLGDFHGGAGSVKSFNIFDLYLSKYKKEFGKIRDIPVVLDCGNGAAGCIVRPLYESVGLKPHILFEEPDGDFPNHHPDPTVAKNLQDLIREVKKTGAVLGIGFDGDADRIGIVDDQGKIIQGDELMALICRDILTHRPQQPIIGDVKCSDRLYAYIEKYGGHPIMWKTGHSLIKEKIKEQRAPFGGELSGHIFFADRNFGYDDALYAGLRVVEILARTGKTVSQLLADFPPAYNTPEIRIDTTEAKKHLIVNRLKELYPEGGKDYRVNLTDGIRISFNDGWALARPSNTQPVLVLRFESSTEAGLKRIQNEIEGVVNPLL